MALSLSTSWAAGSPYYGRESVILEGKSFQLTDNRSRSNSSSSNQDPCPRTIHHLSQVIRNQGGKLKSPCAQQITAVRGRPRIAATSWGPFQPSSCRDKQVYNSKPLARTPMISQS